jgi:ankyrin repeat protein
MHISSQSAGTNDQLQDINALDGPTSDRQVNPSLDRSLARCIVTAVQRNSKFDPDLVQMLMRLGGVSSAHFDAVLDDWKVARKASKAKRPKGPMRATEIFLQGLVEGGLDANLQTEYGTLLQFAINAQFPKLETLLLGAGADLNATSDHDPVAPIFIAIKRDSDESVTRLISHGAETRTATVKAELWTFRDEIKKEPVSVTQYSTICRSKKALRALLENDIDPNGKGCPSGSPALVLAVEGGQTSIAELLLDFGAKVDTVDEYGETALYKACRGPCFADVIPVIALLLHHGANPNTKNNAGVTCLMSAAECSSAKAINLLLEYGADIHAISDAADTVLMQMTRDRWNEDFESKMKVFLDHGGQLNAINRSGDNALNIAIKEQYGKVARALLERGAHFDVEALGSRALAIAAACKDIELGRLLLEAGADPESVEDRSQRYWLRDIVSSN